MLRAVRAIVEPFLCRDEARIVLKLPGRGMLRVDVAFMVLSLS
jgi:hypothetical protein